MISEEKLKEIHYFEHIPNFILKEIAAVAEVKSFEKNDFIVRQHDEANYLYLLCSGRVQFLIRFEGVDDLLVGTSEKKHAIIGWSAFRIPFRYTASVRCERPCETIQFPSDLINKLCDNHPQFGFLFLRKVASTLSNRLEDTRELLFEKDTKPHES